MLLQGWQRHQASRSRGAAIMRAVVMSAGTALTRAEAEAARAGHDGKQGDKMIKARQQQRRGTSNTKKL